MCVSSKLLIVMMWVKTIKETEPLWLFLFYFLDAIVSRSKQSVFQFHISPFLTILSIFQLLLGLLSSYLSTKLHVYCLSSYIDTQFSTQFNYLAIAMDTTICLSSYPATLANGSPRFCMFKLIIEMITKSSDSKKCVTGG